MTGGVGVAIITVGEDRGICYEFTRILWCQGSRRGKDHKVGDNGHHVDTYHHWIQLTHPFTMGRWIIDISNHSEQFCFQNIPGNIEQFTSKPLTTNTPWLLHHSQITKSLYNFWWCWNESFKTLSHLSYRTRSTILFIKTDKSDDVSYGKPVGHKSGMTSNCGKRVPFWICFQNSITHKS